jgi:hypothetical protein
MSRSKNDKDILKALDEMEQVSSELNSRKSREQDRIKKHIKPRPEIKRIDIIKKESQEHLEIATWKLKNKLVIFLTLCAFAEWYIFNTLAKGDLVNFVFYNIAGICMFGLIKMKMNNGGR